ncbi:MAG: hypothetical protein U9O65_05440 [Thermotogota bacterium]|nr:hypothetical protein [Thermotogota bacterium]
MNKKELIQKLEELEWEDFEVKEAKFNVPKNCWNTVSAFSNTNGGFTIRNQGWRAVLTIIKLSLVLRMAD